MKKLNRFVTSFMDLSVVMTSMAPSFVGMAYSAELEPIDQENPEIIEEEILDPEYSHVGRVEDEVFEEEVLEEEIVEDEVLEEEIVEEEIVEE